MEASTLSSDRLALVFSPPSTLYTGSRFDWTTQVRQLTFDGQTILTGERLGSANPAALGWGLAGEFGISTPIGYDDCPVGDRFPKIGVGLLRRPDDQPYRFHRAYEIEPARFAVRSEGPGALLVTADQPVHRGYGWFLKRHWAVRGAELTLTTTLANTGDKLLATEEYIHNFLGLAGVPIGPDWTLRPPRPLSRSHLREWVDPERLLQLSDSELHWTATPSQDFFLSDPATDVPATWTLVHRPTGLLIRERLDVPASAFNLWGCAHVVSPELYCPVSVAPGATASWTRRWTLGREE